MKKLFTIAAMLFAVAMTACTETNENPYDGAPEPVFTLSTSSFEVPQAGGNMEIPFTIENPGEWAQLRATTSTAWIKNLAWDQEKGKITFTAPANNTDDPLTDGVITVAYNFKEYNISVTQLGIAYDYKWTVNKDYFSSYLYDLDDETNVYNACSEMAVVEGEGENMASVGVVMFDIYYDYTKVANSYCYDIPFGTYTVDATNSFAAGTLSAEYSFVSTDVEGEFEETAALVSGTVTITKDGFVARVFDENGKSYRIESDAVHHIDTPMDTFYKLNLLAGDTELAFDGFYLMVDYWGDYYGEGTHNYTLNFEGTDGYTEYTLDIVADTISNSDPTLMLPLGEFTITSDTTAVNYIIPGDIVGGYIVGSTVLVPDWDAGVLRYCFLKSGKVTISTENPEDGADAIYKIEIEAYDDHHAPGYKVSGTYNNWHHGITDKTTTSGVAAAVPAKAAANKQATRFEYKTLGR